MRHHLKEENEEEEEEAQSESGDDDRIKIIEPRPAQNNIWRDVLLNKLETSKLETFSSKEAAAVFSFFLTHPSLLLTSFLRVGLSSLKIWLSSAALVTLVKNLP